MQSLHHGTNLPAIVLNHACIVFVHPLSSVALGDTLAEGSRHVPSDGPLSPPRREKKGSLLRSVPFWPITHFVTLPKTRPNHGQGILARLVRVVRPCSNHTNMHAYALSPAHIRIILTLSFL